MNVKPLIFVLQLV